MGRVQRCRERRAARAGCKGGRQAVQQAQACQEQSAVGGRARKSAPQWWQRRHLSSGMRSQRPAGCTLCTLCETTSDRSILPCPQRRGLHLECRPPPAPAAPPASTAPGSPSPGNGAGHGKQRQHQRRAATLAGWWRRRHWRWLWTCMCAGPGAAPSGRFRRPVLVLPTHILRVQPAVGLLAGALLRHGAPRSLQTTVGRMYTGSEYAGRPESTLAAGRHAGTQSRMGRQNRVPRTLVHHIYATSYFDNSPGHQRHAGRRALTARAPAVRRRAGAAER